MCNNCAPAPLTFTNSSPLADKCNIKNLVLVKTAARLFNPNMAALSISFLLLVNEVNDASCICILSPNEGMLLLAAFAPP